jgi:hypothetical protein
MNNSRDITVTLAGALIGGIAGYLFFTEHGRTVRRRIQPALQDLSRELISFQRTALEVAGVASEGWKLLTDALDEGGDSCQVN